MRWLIMVVGMLMTMSDAFAESIVLREFLDGTEGHLEYQAMRIDDKTRDHLLAGLTLCAYGEERGSGQIEVNFLNSEETAIEELQIATRFILRTVNSEKSYQPPKFCWMVEARGDIRFVKVEIPEVPFVDLSSLEGLRESERRFYLANAASYRLNGCTSVGLNSATVMWERKLDEGNSEIAFSWRHTLNMELVLYQKTGFGLGMDITAVSSKYYKPQYEFIPHFRTPILTESVPVCLEISYRAIHYNYDNRNWPQFSVRLMALNL